VVLDVCGYSPIIPERLTACHPRLLYGAGDGSLILSGKVVTFSAYI